MFVCMCVCTCMTISSLTTEILRVFSCTGGIIWQCNFLIDALFLPLLSILVPFIKLKIETNRCTWLCVCEITVFCFERKTKSSPWTVQTLYDNHRFTDNSHCQMHSHANTHVPCVMLSSLPTARLHTLPLTLGGMPCHQRSLTRRDVHLQEGRNWKGSQEGWLIG